MAVTYGNALSFTDEEGNIFYVGDPRLGASGEASAAGSVLGPVAALLSTRLARAAVEPVNLLMVGSSTVAGLGANIKPGDVLRRMLQARYPRLDGDAEDRASRENLVDPGIHLRIAGAGGAGVASIKPGGGLYESAAPGSADVVIIMIGSNNANGTENVAWYGQQMREILDDYAHRAQKQDPIFVLVHQHRRLSWDIDSHHWVGYGQELQRIAKERDDSLVVDVTEFFDPLIRAGKADFYQGDQVHLTDAGLAMTAEVIFRGMTGQAMPAGTPA